MRKRSSRALLLAFVLLSVPLAISVAGCAPGVRLPVGSHPETRAAAAEPTRAQPTPTARKTEPAEGARPTEPPSRPAPQARSEPRQSTQAPAEPRTAPQQAPSAPLSVVQVAAKVRPAVAQIIVTGTSANLYFEPVPTSGVGSGAIIDSKGLIVTNNHVIADANEIVVSLPDRDKTYNARLVGRDPSTDLAVVQIESDNLPVVDLGDSDSLQIGEPVVAIGNALGLDGGPTVTTGVVSALNRSIDEPNGATLHQLIQTDAAINPGNSGGPLVNLAGQIIGINTAVATGSSEVPAQGIGFAISINSAKPIIEDLIAHGKVRRPYLGVELATVTPALARQYRLPVERGVFAVRVVRGSPAARAGMEAGDIILQIDSDEIRAVADLRKSLSKLKIGQKIKVQVARGAARPTLEVTLGEMPSP